MRPEFRVTIRGGDMQAMTKLAGASFKAAGVPTDAQGQHISDEIWVVVNERDADQARERVEQNLPPDGNYVIERVERVPRTRPS